MHAIGARATEIVAAIHQLLHADLHERVAGDFPRALNGDRGAVGPACSMGALVLHGRPLFWAHSCRALGAFVRLCWAIAKHVCLYLICCVEVINNYGTVLCDDYDLSYAPGVKQAIDEFVELNKFKCSIISNGRFAKIEII